MRERERERERERKRRRWERRKKSIIKKKSYLDSMGDKLKNKEVPRYERKLDEQKNHNQV